MELQVGGEIDAAQRGAAEDFDQALPTAFAIGAGGEQERNVRIVGARQAIAHEQARVRVLDADALIVADFALDRVGPRHHDAAGRRRQSAIGGVQARFDRGALARHAGGLGQPCLVACDQRHRLDQRLHFEGVVGIGGVRKAQFVAQFGDAVFHLDAGVHLHEVVPLAVDDALEGGRRIQLDGAPEAFGFFLHPAEHGQVSGERRDLFRLLRGRGCRNRLR